MCVGWGDGRDLVMLTVQLVPLSWVIVPPQITSTNDPTCTGAQSLLLRIGMFMDQSYACSTLPYKFAI